MITALSMNASIDKAVQIEKFTYGGMNRVVSSRVDAGGKGVNVAVVAKALGEETACIGLLHRQDGEIIEEKLRAFQIETAFVRPDGRVRVNLKLFDREKRVVTEINEPGETVTPDILTQADALIDAYAARSEFLVFTGSVPPGCPKDYYARAIARVRAAGCKCVLDAEGEILTAGIAAKPYLIKPNKMELEKEIGRPLDSIADVIGAAVSVVKRGVRLCCVSLGAQGALLTNGRETYLARAADVAVKSTVGAGDSMVAGMMSAMNERLPLSEILLRGAACATASVAAEGTQLADRAACDQYTKRIKIERV